MAQNNSLNKSSEDFTVDNLFLDGNTLSSTSGTITIDPTTNLLISTGVTNQSVSTAGSTVQYILKNSDNTNSASDAAFYLQSGGTSGGDAYYSWTVGGQGYSMGGDNSDNDYLKMTLSNAFTAGSTVWQMTTAGERTLPLQPAFLGYVGSNILNITGNNTTYIIGDTDVGGGVSLTEVFDQGGDFVPGSASGAVFTAPVTGQYYFSTSFRMDNLGSAHTANLNITTSNGVYYVYNSGASNTVNNNGVMQFGGSVLADMDAADVCTTRIVANGTGADTVDIVANGRNSYFSGYLAC